MTSNINEKYIEYLSHSLQGVNGGIFQRSSLPNGLKKYSFPCPFCSHTRTTGNNKKQYVIYIIIYIIYYIYIYK
jgi:hypothetical protein